jgi:flavin-dependent dehydrogenase
MRGVLGPLGESAVVNEIRRFELFTDGRFATVSLRTPDQVIERSTLIRDLASQAEAAGARVLLGQRFHGLKPRATGLSFTVERGKGARIEEVQARTVIGADGASSQVARAAGWPRLATVPLVQAIVELPADQPPDTTRVWFAPEDTPYFYWLIPESPTRGVLGLIGEAGQVTRQSLERFLEKRGLTPIEFQGAAIPLYTRWLPAHRRVGDGHVYLVGDAAGQVKVTTVGGIVTGFRGALGVAEAILNGGSSRELRALRRELDLHLLIRRTLHRFTQEDYSRLLDLLNGSAQCPLGLYTRDEAARLLWHLCLRQPRLVLLGIRTLLTSSSLPHRIPT